MPITINGSGTVTGISAGGLPDGCIVTADIADNNVTTAKIDNISVTEIKIADNNVTPAKLAQPLTLETAQSATGTEVDFTSIPSWVKRVTVMFGGVSTNGASAVQVQIGAGSILSSGYLGASAWSVNTVGIAASNNTSGFRVDNFGLAGDTRHGIATLALVGTNVWVFSSVIGLSDSAAVGYAGGSIGLAGALDRVRITTVNGTDTFDAGTINIMYE